MNPVNKHEEVKKYHYLSENISDINDILKKYTKPDFYNVFLYMHLGDNFYSSYAAKKFEEQNIHYIIRPQDEIIMRLWNINNYTIWDFNEYLNERIGRHYNGPQYVKEFLYFYSIEKNIGAIPNKDKAFIVFRNNTELFQKNKSLYPGILYRRLISLGISERIKINPDEINYPAITNNTKKRFETYAPLDKIILLCPETKSSTIIDRKIWLALVREFTDLGYTVIENVINSENHIEGTINLDMTLEEVIELAMNCHKIISLRNGLCDILVKRGRDLIILEPKEQYYRALKEFFMFEDNFILSAKDRPIEILLSNNKKPKLKIHGINIFRQVKKNWLPTCKPPVSFVQHIFSIKNENEFKVIRILGFKIKRRRDYGR